MLQIITVGSALDLLLSGSGILKSSCTFRLLIYPPPPHNFFVFYKVYGNKVNLLQLFLKNVCVNLRAAQCVCVLLGSETAMSLWRVARPTEHNRPSPSGQSERSPALALCPEHGCRAGCRGYFRCFGWVVVLPLQAFLRPAGCARLLRRRHRPKVNIHVRRHGNRYR